MEKLTILSQRRFTSELYTGIISLQFESYTLHGPDKNLLFVALKDSSVLALEGDTGSALSSSMVRSNKPSRALFMQILGNHNYLLHQGFSYALHFAWAFKFETMNLLMTIGIKYLHGIQMDRIHQSLDHICQSKMPSQSNHCCCSVLKRMCACTPWRM